MDEIVRVYGHWQRLQGRLDAPDIAPAVRAFIDAGLLSATRVDDRRADPFFAYGSSTTYRCRNARKQVMVLCVWGNTDGWGIEEVEQ